MNVEIISLRERPDLIPLIFSEHLQAVWPKFMRQDAAARLFFSQSVFNHYLDYAFGGLVGGEVIGRAFSIPFAFEIEGRTELPDGGWDQVVRWSLEDRILGRTPTAMSALEIALVPKARGTGNSLAMLGALKARAKALGFAEMFAPVRPSQKHLQPRTPMCEYINLKRADGLPLDAWLRTHVKAGGRIVKIAPYSMTIIGTIAEWAQWTGTAFESSGETKVEGALVPVLVSVEQNYGIYVEPNVWVRHTL